MSFTTLADRMVRYKATSIYKKLEAGRFSFRTAFVPVKKEAYNPKTTMDVDYEIRMAVEIYTAMMFNKGFIPANRRRNYSLDWRRDVLGRMVAKCGLDPDEKTLRAFRQKYVECRLARKACSDNFHYKKPPVLMSGRQAVALMKSKKGARIIYDAGINVVTPEESYGGVICGFITQETLDTLLHKRTITQDVYFNAHGRKSYSLYYPGKSNRLPEYLRGANLDRSYLRACGVAT